MSTSRRLSCMLSLFVMSTFLDNNAGAQTYGTVGAGSGPTNASSTEPVFLLANSMPNATSTLSFDVAVVQNDSSALHESWAWTVNVTNVPVSGSQVVTNEVNALDFPGNTPQSSTTCFYVVSNFPANVTDAAGQFDEGCLGSLPDGCPGYIQSALDASRANTNGCNSWPEIDSNSPCGSVVSNVSVFNSGLETDYTSGQGFAFRASPEHDTPVSLQIDPYYTNATGGLRMLVIGTKTRFREDTSGGLFSMTCMRVNATIDFKISNAASKTRLSTAALLVAGVATFFVAGF